MLNIDVDINSILMICAGLVYVAFWAYLAWDALQELK